MADNKITLLSHLKLLAMRCSSQVTSKVAELASTVTAALEEMDEVKADKTAGVFYIEGTGTTAGTWLGSCDDITEYYDGLTIAYKVGIAGVSGGTTLNINSLGAVSIVRNVSSVVTTHYGVGAVIILTYTTDSSGTAYWKVADYDSDTKTRSSNKTGTKMYLIGAASQSTSGQTTYSNSNVYIGKDNKVYATKGFSGDLTGNADTATKATQDNSGQQIDTTYIKGLSVSGKVITYTKGDDTTGTITTQDTDTTYSAATTSAAGLMSAADKTKLDGIASGANAYTLPSAGSSLGGVKSGGDVTISGGVITVNDDSHNHTIANVDGLQDALDETKTYTDTKISNLINSAPSTLDTLGEIATAMSENADVVATLDTAVGTKANASDLSSHTSNKDNPHGVTLSQLGVSATAAELNYVDGVTSNIQTQLNGKASTSAATTSAAGLMSAADKTKLNGIATGANKYTHPSYTAKTSGLYKVTVDATGHVSAATAVAKSDITALGIPASDTTYSAATDSSAGLMSADDKSKLDGIAEGANKTTVDSSLSSSSTNPVQNKVINSALDGKASSSDLTSHTGNTTVHVTAAERTAWNAKSDFSGSYNDLTNKPTIPAAVTVDSSLSSSSTNPVQNKVINSALDGKVPTTRTVNGKALSSNITLSASDVSAVPTSRTVNGKALSSNITLSASDVGSVGIKYYDGDIDSLTEDGFYRVATNANLPNDLYYSQVIVSKGTSSDTVVQIGVSYQTGKMYSRGANIVDGVANWSAWNEMATADHTHTGYAPAYQYGTADLTAGSSALASGTLYFVYE